MEINNCSKNWDNNLFIVITNFEMAFEQTNNHLFKVSCISNKL